MVDSRPANAKIMEDFFTEGFCLRPAMAHKLLCCMPACTGRGVQGL